MARAQFFLSTAKGIVVAAPLLCSAAPASSADQTPRYTMEQVSGHIAQGEGGFIDQIDSTGAGKKIAGWAVDVGSKRPPRSVQVFVNGVNAGAFPCTINRPDVSQYLGVSEQMSFGFVADVSAKSDEAVKVFAEQNDGSFAEVQ